MLPNSWTARQRYYLYVLPGGDGPPLSVKIDARALKYQEMLAKFRNRDMVERRVEINRRRVDGVGARHSMSTQVEQKMTFDGVDPSLLDPPRQNALSPLSDDASLLALLNSHEGSQS